MAQKRSKNMPPILHSLFEPESVVMSPRSPALLDDAANFVPLWRDGTDASPVVLPSPQNNILAGLNKPQEKAVTITEGPMLILAGPGSGKTRVLTHRIAHLIMHHHVSPKEVLAVTFTNKAAREMSERIEQLVGTVAARQMVISTFHSFGYRLLKHSPEFLLRFHIDSSFTIADERAQEHALVQALKHVNVNGLEESKRKHSALKTAIAQAKNALVSSDTFAQQAEEQNDSGKRIVAQVYKRYEQELHIVMHMLDFEDLLSFSVSLLRLDEKSRHYCQQRWSYVHVDEWQDCNIPQYRMIQLISMGTAQDPAPTHHVCVVGDDDQRIYTWRGAGAKSITDFENDFAPVTSIILNQNYRSTQTIVTASQQLIRENTERKEKALWTAREAGTPITLVVTEDEEEQARYVVETIQDLFEQGIITSWKQVAVLYRTNAQSQTIEEACVHAGLPYTLYGSTPFFDRKEVKDFLAYLSILVNPADAASFLRCVNCPPRGIGKKSVQILQDWADLRGISLTDAVMRVIECPTLSSSAQRAIGHFGALLKTLRESVETMSLSDLLDQIIQVTGFETQFDQTKEDERDRWENVVELRRVLVQFAGLETFQALEACLEHISLMSTTEIAQNSDGRISQEPNKKETITLLTLHSSKGLEYKVCFIIGCDEGLLPHARGGESKESEEEELRLAYVGFTRAMDQLYMTRTHFRDIFGKRTKSSPSRFLRTIPSDLLQTIQY